jgi:hypothetical protein
MSRSRIQISHLNPSIRFTFMTSRQANSLVLPCTGYDSPTEPMVLNILYDIYFTDQRHAGNVQ